MSRKEIFLKLIKLFRKNRNKDTIEKKDYKKIDFSLLEKLHKYHDTTDLSIDKVTWNDLDMKKVFAKINYTTTFPGEETLYYWLHNPTNDKELLDKRNNHIINLSKDENIFSKLRTILSKAGYIKYDYREIISSGFKKDLLSLIFTSALVLISIISIIYSVVTFTSTLLALILAIFIINNVIHYYFVRKIGSKIEVLSYTLHLLMVGKKLPPLIKNICPELSDELHELFVKLKNIYKKSSVMFQVEGLDFFADYINILFLLKERNYLLISNTINKYKKELLRLYEIVGEIDALVSIGAYRKELDYYCLPELDENRSDLYVKELYHPLIEHPVSNDIDTYNSVAITGSNMSGKSTFLRTLGINTIFAQSIFTCLASSYKGKFFRVITSINLSDDITESKSYFLMEAEAIKRMVEMVDEEISSLILIDEIFKGTNPTERIAAAMEILNLLAVGNTLTFVATHDLQILPQLKGYDFYYFTESVTDEKIEFDHKMYKGIAPTRNAIKILRYLKYPKALLEKIDERIKNIEINE